ncbi:hypothetical protein GLOIN_2v1485023 [Rhizophagus clarus]|uniref:Reverse transcriptase domain-containing protein n=2 Tax=Rhizophagus clarus TaxID=94130 RepID=A0A8H3QYB5_9GLOM|nr:hypothetical protein GLOIN_2v1485023 [Rhizophagus clarus]
MSQDMAKAFDSKPQDQDHHDEDESLGYSMELEWLKNIPCNERQKISIQTAASAYADDTQWIAKNKDKAEKIVSIANKFFDINDIKINGKKSEIIIVNPKESNKDDRSLKIGKNKDKVIANKGSVPIRILGVRKHITHAQAIYIVNTILLPRLEYRLKITIWEDGKYEEIFRPVMKEVKYKTRLPSNCHDNILLHSAQGKLKNLWRNQVGAQITEFLVTLNSKSKQADILKMRLKKAQLKLNITTCILLMEPDVTVPNKIQNNYAYNVMRKAHDYLFKFQPLAESEEWEIQIIGPSIRNFVYQQAPKMCKKDKELIIRKAAAFSIHGVLQLVTQDASGTLTWLQICDINKRPARGRIPRWFTLLRNLIQNAHDLENYYITSAKPNNKKRDSDINEKN